MIQTQKNQGPMAKAKGLFSFVRSPEPPLYAPYGGEVAELRIAQTQQHSFIVWSGNGRNLETRQVLVR